MWLSVNTWSTWVNLMVCQLDTSFETILEPSQDKRQRKIRVGKWLSFWKRWCFSSGVYISTNVDPGVNRLPRPVAALAMLVSLDRDRWNALKCLESWLSTHFKPKNYKKHGFSDYVYKYAKVFLKSLNNEVYFVNRDFLSIFPLLLPWMVMSWLHKVQQTSTMW